ncbi:hypothetical protein [Catenulispora sp. GP43]|uniref:hypothetical protein n=1 Tax=Catenulispora sp. GP43 TaxID=3156263 RepID=UPI003514B438
MKTDHAGVLATVRETGQFSDDTVSAFKDAVAQFKRGFELGDGTLLADQGKAEAMDADNVGQLSITKHVKAK